MTSDARAPLGRLRPNAPTTLDSRGFVYLRLERPREALADYNAALGLRPQAATSLYGRGLAYLKLSDQAQGERDIAAARQADPDVASKFRRWGVAGP